MSASPTELVAECGAAAIEARPIWARYHAICSGVSSLAWAMPGVNSAAARAREELEDSLIMPGMFLAHYLRGPESASIRGRVVPSYPPRAGSCQGEERVFRSWDRRRGGKSGC